MPAIAPQRSSAGLALAVLVATISACAASAPSAGEARAPSSGNQAAATCYDRARPPAGAPRQDLESFHGPMAVVVPTRMAAELTAIGLDPKHLPAFEDLDRHQIGPVMRTFTRALGVGCTACHDAGDFHKKTARKQVARRMWNEFVRTLAMEDGAPLYCDSCHQGQLKALDHRDAKLVSAYMDEVYVGKLKRVDGKEHDCATCHGDPPEFGFLAEWAKGGAPIARPAVSLAPPNMPPCPRTVAVPFERPAAMASEAEGGGVTATPAPTTSAAPAPAPAKPTTTRPRGTAAGCGSRDNPCPLQLWMRRKMGPALAAKDAAALAAALDKMAATSPDASWTWAEMSKTAADAARRGDITAARASCQGCHKAYKVPYQEKFRLRPAP